MRVRDIFSLNTMADTLARLPDVLTLSLLFTVLLVPLAVVHLMEARRVLDGLLLAGMIILLWLCILALGKQVESAETKLVNAHNVLINIASQKCRCDPNAIIIEAPEEPELVGKPAPKGYCNVCQAHALLKEQCPEAFEPVSKDNLAAYYFSVYCHSFMRIGTRNEFEAHQAKPQ